MQLMILADRGSWLALAAWAILAAVSVVVAHIALSRLNPEAQRLNPEAHIERTQRAAVSDGSPDPLVPRERRARWAVLASLTLVSFLLLLDDSAIALALPAMRQQLGFGLAGLEWVINGYTLPLAALMLLGGQLADRHGRRRVFLIGLAIFTLASLLAGIAGDTATLIGARALQGVGAALVAPASLSIIAVTFPVNERGWALGVWAGVTATALGLGPLLGALVTDSLGWAWIFLLNVPLGGGAWLVARALLSESRAEHPARHLDVPGVVSSAIALSGLLLVLTQGNDYGWSSARTPRARRGDGRRARRVRVDRAACQRPVAGSVALAS